MYYQIIFKHNCLSSDQSLSRVWPFATLWTAALRASLSFTISRICSDSCPLCRWCHPTISSSVVPFSSHLQSFLASGSFSMSQFFASGGRSVGVSASASVLLMNIQDWSPLGWTGWISLQSNGLSSIFSNTTVQKHQLASRETQQYLTALLLMFLLFSSWVLHCRTPGFSVLHSLPEFAQFHVHWVNDAI